MFYMVKFTVKFNPPVSSSRLERFDKCAIHLLAKGNAVTYASIRLPRGFQAAFAKISGEDVQA